MRIAGWWTAATLLGIVAMLVGPSSAARAATVEPPLEDLFAVHLTAPAEVPVGAEYRAVVYVERPYGGMPVVDAEVTATLGSCGDDDDDGGFVETGRTGGDGRLELRFLPPARLCDGALSVMVRHAGWERRVSGYVALATQPQVVASTDRKLYRPGDVVHVRGLLLDAHGRADAGRAVTMTIRGDGPIFRGSATTSRLGIASFEWPTTATTAPEGYWVSFATSDGGIGGTSVRLRPFEGAILRIDVSSEPEVHLPGDAAALVVEVRRQDGAPVAGASVTAAPVWEGAPFEAATATTRDDGIARLPLDLEPLQRWLAADGRRYLDLHLSVTATDPLGGRGETVRAVVRASREPIHVYLVGRLPAFADDLDTAWVTTTNAAGIPVAADVELRSGERVLGVARTGAQGVASLSIDAAEAAALDPTEDALVLTAVDDEGRRTRQLLRGWGVGKTPAVGVLPSRSLYREGEPLRVELRPSAPLRDVIVEVSTEQETLARRRIDVLASPLALDFPWREGFTGVVTVRAWSARLAAGGTAAVGRRAVLYPRIRRLSLTVASARARYRPGERAALRFAVDGSAGSSPAALAVAVVDGGVAERQRQEGFGGRPALFAGLPREGLALAGWTLERLAREGLDGEAPAEPDLDVVAQALLFQALRHRGSEGVETNFSSPIGEERRLYHEEIDEALAPVERALGGRWGPPVWLEPETVLDLETLSAAAGVDVATLRDPWGTPFRYEVDLEGGRRVVTAESAGRDRAWDTFDDFWAVSWSHHYFTPVGRVVDRAFHDFLMARGHFPAGTEEALAALRAAGVDLESRRDPRGGGYSLRLDHGAGSERFEIVTLEDREARPAREVVVWSSSPRADALEMRIAAAIFRPKDPDLTEIRDAEAAARRLAAGGLDVGAWRDRWGRPYRLEVVVRTYFADHLRYGSDPESAPALETRIELIREILLVSAGADGRWDTDDDPTLARVDIARLDPESPDGTPLRAAFADDRHGVLRGTVTDDGGVALPGVTVRVGPVGGGAARHVTVTGPKGAFALTLPVGTWAVAFQRSGFATARYPRVPIVARRETELAPALKPGGGEARVVTGQTVTSDEVARALPPRAPEPITTPRLRKDFPETLLWIPELVAEDGEVTVDLALADTVTTWRLAALASTLDGRLATAELEIPATMPFHVEPDPPATVTAGDTIGLPVLVLDETAATAGAGDALAVSADLGGDVVERRTEAAAVARVDLPLRFAAPGEAVLRVAATRGEHADAVERRVEVRHDGESLDVTRAALVAGATPVELAVDVPPGALPGSASLEVTVTAGLAEHLRAAVAGLARLPTGCAEQVTSTAWASLLLLDLEGDVDGAAVEEARRHVERGRDALLARDLGDGVAFWPGGEPDVELTAYVLSFLVHASARVDVDPVAVAAAARFLVRRRDPDGGWRGRPPFDGVVDPIADLRTGALVALALAETAARGLGDAEVAEAAGAAVARLGRVLATSNDPWALAVATLAAVEANDLGVARALAGPLRRLADDAAGGGTAWHLRSVSPFFGGGRAGRIETTAWAVRALASVAAADGAVDPLAASGLVHLLVEKDAWGSWWSTQSTLQALRALGAALPPRAGDAAVRVVLDGSDVRIAPAAAGLPSTSALLPVAPGGHVVTARDVAASGALVQATLRWHEPWRDDQRRKASARGLRLAVDCAPLSASPGEEVTCAVEASPTEALPGMLVAEIGLPPGADVDRAALDAESGLSFAEVWPDRVVAYLWSHPDGTRFTLRFRPRYPIDALAAPSRLWHYYDPDATVAVAPARFRVLEP